MLKIGLTGGIGCGKSTAVARFREWGIPIIEADVIARQVVEPAQPALQDIVAYFGLAVLQTDGSLNRRWLREQVFNDAVALNRLETILHPRIKTQILEKMAIHINSPYVMVDVPLLFEKQYSDLFDRILVIDCLPTEQKTRVKLRDGSDDSLIDSIMQTQIDRESRLTRADDIIQNSDSINHFYHLIDAMHGKYIALANT